MLFDLQPNLKGKLVELKPLQADDYRDLYAVAADPLSWQQDPMVAAATVVIYQITASWFASKA